MARNAIAAGERFTCVLTPQGVAECWGANEAGQLGGGSFAPSAGRTLVSGGRHYTQISASGSTACAVADDESAWCWGIVLGTLGKSATDSSAVPVRVSGGLHFRVVDAANQSFCGLTTAGTVYCWGANNFGQLGNGASLTTSSPTPVPVSGGRSFTGLTSAFWASCGITSSGTAYCWGSNDWHQLGVGSAATAVTTPTPLTGNLSFSDVKLGIVTSCGIAAGKTYCWGANVYGSLGAGDTASTTALEPTPIAAGFEFSSVYPSGGNNIFTPVCALTSGGAAYCWGANHSGQLGTTATTLTCDAGLPFQTECTGTPLAVTGGFSFKSLAVGAEHVCGITTTGQVACWGLNDRRQLGVDTPAKSSAPILVPGIQAP